MTISPLKVLSSRRTTFRELAHSLVQYRHLLTLLIWRDLTVRYKQTAVGILWLVLQPILFALIFAFVFNHLIHIASDGIPYLLFAYSGITLWSLFANGVDKSSGSIVGEERLITRVYFPRWILPLAAIGGIFLDFCATMIVLVCISFFLGVHPGWHVVLVFPAVGLMLGVTMAAGIAAAFLCAKFRDFRFLLMFLLQIGQFVTPVFYTLSLFPEKYLILAYLNPLAGPMELFRVGLTGMGHFSSWGFCLSLLMGFLMVLASLTILYEMEDDLIDNL